MKIARLHRRLVVLMSLASLLAFWGGAGVEAVSAILASAGPAPGQPLAPALADATIAGSTAVRIVAFAIAHD